MSDLYDIRASWDTTAIPNNECCGCYVIYDEDRKPLYVGKSSLKSFLGHRVASYFRKGGAPHLNHWWSSPPRYLQTIAVTASFEAPFLEEFLIFRLRPRDNVRGRVIEPRPAT